MARDFSKNTSNTIDLGTGVIGALLNGATDISFHCWAVADTFGTAAADNNALFALIINSTNTTGFVANVDAFTVSGSPVLRVGARSVSTDTKATRSATTVLLAGTWYALGGTVDIPGDAIYPYVNGQLEGPGSATFANAVYTHGTPSATDMIAGERTISTARQWDGRIAELAFWAGRLLPRDFLELNAGLSPMRVRPDRLVGYFPLYGQDSPERDLRGGAVGTITGTVAAYDHPAADPFRAAFGVRTPAVTGLLHSQLERGVRGLNRGVYRGAA